MKKLISIIAAVTVFAGSAIADEGMWLLPLLEKMNGKAMQELGCELIEKVSRAAKEDHLTKMVSQMVTEETLTKISIKILTKISAVKIKTAMFAITDRAAEDAIAEDAAVWTFRHLKNH